MRRTFVGIVCVLAACGSGKRGTSTKSPDSFDDPDAPRRAAFVVTESVGLDSHTTAADAKYLYWIDEGGLKRRPHGPDQKTEVVTDTMAPYAGAVMLVVGDRAYVYLDTEVVSVSLAKKGAEPEPIATLPTHINAFYVDAGGGVVVASEGQIVEVAAGKQPRVLASNQGGIANITIDADFAYFATDGSATPAAGAPAPGPYYQPYDYEVPKTGALHRVARKGGNVEDLATGVSTPYALQLADGRLWWTSDDPAVQSVPLAGGEVKLEVVGRAYSGESLQVDAGGVVYEQMSGAIYERRADTLHVAFVPDGTWGWTTGFVLSPDWIYVTAPRADGEGKIGVVAVPRQPQPLTVLFAMERTPRMMMEDDDSLYWIEVTRENDGRSHIMRGDPDAGTKKELADYETWIAEMAVGGGQLYFTDQYSISNVSTRGGPIKSFDSQENYVIGLNVHRNHVYWFDGTQLFARKKRGGPAFSIGRSEGYYGNDYYGGGYYGGYGYGDGGGQLAFDDDYVYTTGFGNGGQGVYQISEQGKVKLLWDGSTSGAYPSRELLMLGDELFFTTTNNNGMPAVWRLTLDGDATSIYQGRGESYGAMDLIEGGGMLYLLSQVGYAYEIARIDPSTGEAQVVLRFSSENMNESPTIAADDRALYISVDWMDAIWRLSHGAPKVPEPGWPPVTE